MSESFWAAIIVGALGIAGTLGGVWLTQRHAAKLAREARAEVRRGELRILLTDVVTNSGQIVAGLGMGLAASQFMDQHDLSTKQRLKAYGDGIAGIQSSLAALPRQLTETVLLASDKELRGHLEALSRFFLGDGIKLSLGSMEIIAEGHAAPEVIAQRMEELRVFAELVGKIQTRGEELLSVEL
ncbi:MAG: hypothetical protein J0H23_02800 [Micrococcales bacterium]|nr:hypothetical protein [Micrococcales bacterium]